MTRVKGYWNGPRVVRKGADHPSPNAESGSQALTLEGLQAVSLYDDAELQHQLGSALQERGKQVKHAHVRVLVDHLPVKPPPVILSALSTSNT